MIDDIMFVHPKDVQDGVIEITGNDILTNLPYAPGGAHRLRPPPQRDAAQPRRCHEPRDQRERAVRGPGRLRVLRRCRGVPAGLRRADDRRRPGRLGAVRAARHPRPAGLDAAQLPDGQPHRPRPLPRLPGLELPADDAAHRRGAAARHGRGDPGPAGRRRARPALPPAVGAVRRAAAPGERGARRPGRRRPPRGGGHPRRQPVHDLRAVPRVPGVGARAVGPA